MLKPGAAGNSFVYADHLGAPRAIADGSTGRVVWRWESEPFGSIAADDDPDKDATRFVYNLRFPGQYYDQEAGLHYNYYRDYNPGVGRYVQSDPIGIEGGINTYVYIDGNPVDAIDSTGTDTYVVNRDLSVFGSHAQPRWNPATHTFVATTNSAGTVSATYSWGNDAN